MFRPDQPINSSHDDLLGRSVFSQSFGRALISYRETESLVTALYGDWGSGKSSMLNLAIEHIELLTKDANEHEKPIIVRFNPWNYSDQVQLISQFFQELSSALQRKDYGQQVKEVGEKLAVYSKFFTPLALVLPQAQVLQQFLKNIGEAAQGWGEVHSNDLKTMREDMNRLLAEQKRKIIIVIDDIDRLNNTEIRQIFQLVLATGTTS